ncbi:modular serine protease-like [Homalodisca vitripennis]|uniref:modular serine protease-like n=1 Tax=Homalodisca vitripennis TaxID=197043 RepID=UPI001EEC75C1|nr:modular serine protease-like [Homalodisca vitripennis]
MGDVALCLLIVIVNICLCSNTGNTSHRLTKRKATDCPNPQEFQCNSGQCISQYDVCDGVKHCSDSSDETSSACRQVLISTCTPTTFQCDYGACISKALRCDGKSDCVADGSDEVGCENWTVPQPLPVSASVQSVSAPAQVLTPDPTPSSVCNSIGYEQTYVQCDNGQCIDKYSICDGVIDCRDKSDETEAACSKTFQGTCPEGLWRCNYGACLRMTVLCNKRNDCWDGSDEADCVEIQRPKQETIVSYPAALPRPSVKPTTVQSTVVRPTVVQTPVIQSSVVQSAAVTGGKSCAVPTYAQNRQFTVLNCKGVCGLTPGQTVPDQTLMVVTCDPGHQRNNQNSQSITSCTNGQWFPDIPHCAKLCPSLTSTTVDMLCWQGPDEGCDKPMLPGTKITFKCKEHYKTNDQNSPNMIRCEESGQWSGQLPHCTPKCGQSNLDSYLLPTVLGGNVSKVGNFPWHAAIFHNREGEWQSVCGGTLITSRIVLTAAHCVTGQSRVEPPVFDVQDVIVALGKYYRDWSIHEDTETVVTVREIHVHPLYRGEPQHFGEDIATLVLAYDVSVNSFVMPACVDYSLSHVDKIFRKQGYVAGWGNTMECSGFGAVCDSRSTELLFTKTSIMSYQDCYRATQPLHPASDSKLTNDKYCAGNGTVSIVQQGDSGGGLTFVFDGNHYVYGIVSTKLKLDINNKPYYSFASFTSVPYHMDWLRTQVY